MATRMAIVAGSRHELVRGLEEFLRVAKAHTPVKPGTVGTSVPIFIGDLEGDGAEIRSLLAGKAGDAMVQVLLAEHYREKLALHWTQGGDIPWDALHADTAVHKVPLPNYPFARQRYWIAPEVSSASGTALAPLAAMDARGPHPLLNPPPSRGRAGWGGNAMSTHDKIASVLTALLSEALGLPVDEVKPNKSFQEYGADSIAVLKMTCGLEETFDAKVTGREMLDYPTVASLSRYLADRLERQIEPGESQSASPTATAGVPDVPVAVEPYPLSKVQEGLWLLQ